LRHWARRYPVQDTDLLRWDLHKQHEYGVFLAGEVSAHAEKVIVNSQFSADVARLEGEEHSPVASLPLAILSENTAVETRSDSPGPPLELGRYIVCQGPITPWASADTVIHSFSILGRKYADLKLVIAGPYEGDSKQQLTKLASQLGCTEQLTLLDGPADPKIVAAAGCAVQLNFPSGGGWPLPGMSSLALGVPTIVSDHGPFRDLPEEAAKRVPPEADPQRLAQAIEEILGEVEIRRRLSEGGSRYAAEACVEKVGARLLYEIFGVA
jgi:glycosyltransferase involved in cell wall biosynthesis